MATIRVWPNILPSGVSIAAYAEDGVTPIPAAGGAQVEDSEYYRNQRALSRILDHDPLALGGNPLVITSFTSTTAASLNAAISHVSQRGGGRIVVPLGDYVITGVGTDRILLQSNVELIFEPGCTITTGVPTGTSFPIFIDSTTGDKENIKIVGNGLVVTGHRGTAFTQHLLTVNCQNVGDVVRNIHVSGITLSTANHDGLLTGGNVGVLPEGIVYEDVTCTDCGRCGMAEINAAGCVYIRCHFDENGYNGDPQNPLSGVDIEVDNVANAFMINRDGRFIECTFNRNWKSGIAIQGPTFGITTRYRFFDCEANDNGVGGLGAGFGSNCPGNEFYRCRAWRNAQQGFHAETDTTYNQCWAKDNGEYGFRVQISGTRVDLIDCVAEYNGVYGMLLNTLFSARGTINVVNPTVRCNTVEGIVMSGAHNASVRGGTVELNGEHGIRMIESTGCHVAGVRAQQNGTAADNTYSNIIVSDDCAQCGVSGLSVVRQSSSYHRGTAVSGSTTTAVLATHASVSGPTYVNGFMRVLSGTRAGDSAWVTGYDETTRTLTFAPALGGAIDATSVIEIVGGYMLECTAYAATSTTVTLPEDFASARNDVYNGATLIVISGTGAGQRVAISDYVGSTRVLTVASMSPVLDDTSVIRIVRNTRPRYGIRADATARGTIIGGNDAYCGGATAAISDAGSGTISYDNRET